MKKYLAAAAVAFFLLAGAAFFLFLSPRPFAPAPPEAGTEAPRSSESPANAPRSGPLSAASNSAKAITAQAASLADKAGQYIPPAEAPTNLPPAMILENMRRIFHQYGAMYGGNPVGTNPEITAALAGKNPKQINFLAGQPGMQIDAGGELLDPWGTPYFFHQLSGTVMEIHSAGPDKRMWTADDLVVQ